MAGNRRTRGVKQPNRPFVVRCGYALLCSVSLWWLVPAADLFAADTNAASAESLPIPDKDLFEPIDPVKLDDKGEVVSPMLGGKEQPLKAGGDSIPGFKPPPVSGKEKTVAQPVSKSPAATKAKTAAIPTSPAMPVELQPIPEDTAAKEAAAPAVKDLSKPPTSLTLTPPMLPPTQLPPPPSVADAVPAKPPAKAVPTKEAAKAPSPPIALPAIPAAAKPAVPAAPVLPPVASEAAKAAPAVATAEKSMPVAAPVKTTPPVAASPVAAAPSVPTQAASSTAPPPAVEVAKTAPVVAKAEKPTEKPTEKPVAALTPAKAAAPVIAAPPSVQPAPKLLAPATSPAVAVAAPATAPPATPPPVLPSVSAKTADDAALLPPVTITMPQIPDVAAKTKEPIPGGPVELPAEQKNVTAANDTTSPAVSEDSASAAPSEPKPVRMAKAPVPVAKPEAPEQPVVSSSASRPNHASWYSGKEPMPLIPPSRIPSDVDEMVRRLPSGLSSRSMPEPPEPPVSIERVTDESDFPDDGYADDQPIGASARKGQNKSTVDEQLNQAYEALMMGQTESAVSMYRRVLMEDPRNKLGMFGLATSLHRNGQYAQAQRAYAELLSYYPNYTDGLNNFFALMSDLAPGDAIRQLNELARRNPDFSPIPAQMGMIYMKNGEYENAASSLARAVSLSPENITYRYNLAIALDKMGQNTEAVRLYQQVLEAMQNQKDSTIQLDAKNIQERLIFLRSKGT